MIERIEALIEKAKKEAESLRLMSYHGSGADEDDPNWYADLTNDDVDGIAALLRRCAESSLLLLAVAKDSRALFMDGLNDPPNSVIFDPHGAVEELGVLAGDLDGIESYCAEHLPEVTR